MNKIEEIVYHAVYRHPALKLFIRNIYQSVFDIFPRKADMMAGKSECKEGYFFGFHDVSPFSVDETKVLANKIAFDFRMPKKGEGIDIGFFDFKEGKLGSFHKMGTTYAWNYHKGCRLQWIDKRSLIYNTAKDNVIISKILNVESGEETILPYPIDTIYNSDKELVATTFSYERLQKCMPGYGYPYSDESYNDKKHPVETGLFLVDLKTSDRKLIISCDELAEQFCENNPEQYYHYVTHTEFSKDGRYISFLYRRMIEGGDINRRITKMIVFDRQTEKLIELPTQTSGSHYVWNSKKQIIASCIINNKSCHVLYDINDVDNYKIICPDILNQDGHQTFVDDNTFITDTYPDKWRQCQLYLVNMKDNTARKILNINYSKKFVSKTVYNYIDCDLHPKVSPSGRYVSCDVVNTGVRSLFVMEVVK